MSVTRLTKDQFIPFLDINKDKTFENSNWTRIDYSTIFELTINETEEDIHYICFENPITVVTSNKPELPQEIALYEGNPMYDFMFDQLYNLPIGEDCKVPFILAFGGSEKRAWRGICTISGKTLNTIDGRISFSMKIGGEITKGFYKITDGKVEFIIKEQTPTPSDEEGSKVITVKPTVTVDSNILSESDVISSSGSIIFASEVEVTSARINSRTFSSAEAAQNYVFANSYYTPEDRKPWKAFDGNESTLWSTEITDNTAGMYLGYNFLEPISNAKIRMTTSVDDVLPTPQFKFQGCVDSVINEDSVWEDLTDVITLSQYESKQTLEYTVNSDKAYCVYRLYLVRGSQGTNFGWAVYELSISGKGGADVK